MEEDRIIKIETMLAHQEQQIQDLNDVITQQSREIEILKARLGKTQAKILDLEQNIGEKDREGLTVAEQAALDKPPHY